MQQKVTLLKEYCSQISCVLCIAGSWEDFIVDLFAVFEKNCLEIYRGTVRSLCRSLLHLHGNQSFGLVCRDVWLGSA